MRALSSANTQPSTSHFCVQHRSSHSLIVDCVICAVPLIAVRLDKIFGKAESKQSDELDEEVNDNTERGKAEEETSSLSAAAPIDPAVELGITVPPGQRVWLDEPPGLRKPPYLPPSPAAVSPSSSLPLIAPSSLTALRPASITPTTAEQPIIRIPLPTATQSPGWQHPFRPPPPPPRPSAAVPTHPHPAFRTARPPRSSSHAEPPEIDPLDPNPDTALDVWNSRRARGRTTASATATPPPPPAAAVVSAQPAARVVPRPAFVPTHLLVKNRPTSADTAACGRSIECVPAG